MRIFTTKSGAPVYRGEPLKRHVKHYEIHGQKIIGFRNEEKVAEAIIRDGYYKPDVNSKHKGNGVGADLYEIATFLSNQFPRHQRDPNPSYTKIFSRFD